MTFEICKYHGEYNIRPRNASDVRYIVVHYTGSGTSAEGAARANCIYFSGGDRQASAHYFIDDGSIYEYADPAEYLCWHVGDGRGVYGITNTNSIGIEICMDGDNPFTEREIARLQWLVCKLMHEFNVPAERVVRHYDASRKLCPYYYTPGGAGGNDAWRALHEQITTETPTAGWVKSGGRYWYRNADGTWPTGWAKIGGVWYCFDSDGWMMANQWTQYNGAWYWLKASGAMAADECLCIHGRWYAFAPTGKMHEKQITLRGSGSMIL